MRGSFQHTETGKRHKSEHEERSGSGAEKPIVKTDQRNEGYAEKKRSETSCPINIAKARLDGKIDCDGDQEDRQGRAHDIHGQNGCQQCAEYRADERSERFGPLFPDIDMPFARIRNGC